MTSKDQFQAEVVAGIATPGSAEATKTFQNLLKIVESLEGAAQDAGKKLVEAFKAGAEPEKLAAQIRILKRELQFLSTGQKGLELFKDSDVKSVNDITRAINAAAKAYDSMRRSQAISNSQFGLDAKNVSEASRSLKSLEKDLNAVSLALSKDSGNASLQNKKKLLEDNQKALSVYTEDLKKQAAQEKLAEQIAAANFAASKARYSEVQRLAQQRKQEEGSASAMRRNESAQFDYSQRGRDYSSMQSRIRDARISSDMLHGKEDIALNRLMAQSSSAYLGQVYKDAGLAQATIKATVTDGAKVRQIVGEIRDIEAKMVEQRARGNKNLQDEALLLDQIRQKQMQITNLRREQNLNDPETRQARQDATSRNMLSRASGEGGAALLAVQASLMANYSILNTFTSSLRSAVTTSVELEAAFRNVQAVTGTTRVEMAGLEDKIKGVAAQSKFTSIEVANAALTLGQAGLSARQVGDAIGPVVALANAAGTSIAQAVDLVTSIVGVFDKTSLDIADIANKVTQAANSSKVSVEKLALAFQYVGNGAFQMGISFEEVTAALAAMSNAGIKSGSTMGTGLRQFLTETAKPSKEFIATLQRLGLSLSDIDFRANGLIGVTQKLREAGFVASDAIKSFDVRGAAAFNALIANPEEIQRQYKMLQDTNAAVEANAIQMDSLKSQSARLTTSLANLASAGFEPLSRLLAVVAGGFATVIQAMSEHNVLAGIAVTTLAALAASGAVAYMASMAAGALRMAGAAGTASVALTALQSASKAGSLAALVAGISASVSAMATVTPVAGAATAATFTLSGAITTLKTAFMGLSIVTGVGLAVAAATAGFWAFSEVSGSAAKEIEGLKAKTNSAKGSFEETDATVQSLTKKIEDLIYREQSLKNTKGALELESQALASQFGKIGYVADTNNASFDTMIKKLRMLKDEMAEVRKQGLEAALGENKNLLAKQVEQLTESVSGARGNLFSGGIVKGMNNALTSSVLKMTDAEKQKLQSAIKQIQGGDINNLGDLPGARLIMQNQLARLRSQGQDNSVTDNLDKVITKLDSVVKNMTEVNNTRSEIASLDFEKARTENFKAFNNSGMFGAKNMKALTFDEAMPRQGNLEIIAREAMGLAKDASPMEVFEAIKTTMKDRSEQYNELAKRTKDAMLNGRITDDVYNTAIQRVNAAREKDKNAYLEIAGATEDEATRTYNAKRRLLMSQQKNAKMKNDRQLAAQLEGQLGELEIDYKTRAETNPTRALITAEELRAVRDQNIANIFDRPNRGATRDVSASIQERSAKVRADAAEAEANANKSKINTAQTLEDVAKLMDDAIEARFEAKKQRLAALALKQKEDAGKPGFDAKVDGLAQRLEMNALAEGEDSKIQSFADSFIGLIESAMKRLDETTKKINESKRKISENKLDAEDRIFEAQQALRETELALLLGKKVKGDSKTSTTYGAESSGIDRRTSYDAEGNAKTTWKYSQPTARTTFGPNGVRVANMGTGSTNTLANTMDMTVGGVQTAIRETLNERKNRLVIEAAKIELEENEKALAEYGDSTSGLIKQYSDQYKAAKEATEKLREKLKLATNEADRAAAQAGLNVAEKTEGESFKGLREARGDRQKLLVENYAIQKRISENMEALPEEVTLDSLLKKLDEVWAKYQSTVGEMNMMKTMSDGMTAILGNQVGSLGNAFASIVTGTKSAKEAFRDMATSMIKSMIDIMAQMAAMAAVKGLIQMFMAAYGGASGADAGATSAEGVGDYSTYAASGGLIVPGGIQRVKGMARGGTVNGGIPGRDSVPTMLMPGEFVLRKQAVDALGTDYLHGLNSVANNVVSSSAPRDGSESSSGGGAVVNVYVVTPDQKPTAPGPKDIIAVVTDDMMRGGSLKKLVRQVATNQM